MEPFVMQACLVDGCALGFHTVSKVRRYACRGGGGAVRVNHAEQSLGTIQTMPSPRFVWPQRAESHGALVR